MLKDHLEKRKTKSDYLNICESINKEKQQENINYAKITELKNKKKLLKKDLDEYDSEYEGEYKKHHDVFWINGTNYHRKLSAVVQLSDPDEYVGGKLQFMINRDIIDAPMGKGTVIFFPSYLLHRVTKVEKGWRNSLVCWFHGPPFS